MLQTNPVTVTGSISNTSLTEAQLASHNHNTIGNYNGEPPKGSTSRITGSSNNPDARAGNPYNASNLPILLDAGSGTGHNHSHTLSGTLTGNITTTLTGAVTASGTNSFSPYVVVNYIIKH